MRPPHEIIELDRARQIYFSAFALSRLVSELKELPEAAFNWLQDAYASEPRGAQRPEPDRLLRLLTLGLSSQDKTLAGKDGLEVVCRLVDKYWIAKGRTWADLATHVLRAAEAVGYLYIADLPKRIAMLEKELELLRTQVALQDEEEAAKRERGDHPEGEEGDDPNARPELGDTNQPLPGSEGTSKT